MRKISKRFEKGAANIDARLYSLDEAVQRLKAFPKAKFDETVELNFYLGIDVKKPEQMVRGSVSLPHGTGKSVRVLVFCRGEEAKAAEEAGAEYVGADDLIAKISGGWMDFDVVVAHPEMMKDITKLGKLLGPRGLMPSPKVGTVTKDLARAVVEIKKGRIDFRSDKNAGIHAPVAKLSFDAAKIADNARAFIKAIIDSKPQSSKGTYLRSVAIASTMGPGISLDPASL